MVILHHHRITACWLFRGINHLILIFTLNHYFSALESNTSRKSTRQRSKPLDKNNHDHINEDESDSDNDDVKTALETVIGNDDNARNTSKLNNQTLPCLTVSV